MSNFKLNQTIIVSNMHGSKLATVTKITPTGQFETSITNDTKFRPDGTEKTTDRWGRSWCKEASEAEIKDIKDRDYRLSLKNQVELEMLQIKSFSAAKLERILAAMKD